MAAVLLVAPACTSGDDDDVSRPSGSAVATSAPAASVPATTVVDRPRGGTVRVGVWAQPDVGAPTLGGAAVRALVLPQLFTAQPDGSWAPSLVEPGTESVAEDLRSVEFRLRPGAVWSDGAAITVDDLRRTADGRFVAGIDGPGHDGLLTVRFTQPLPGWRRLWSGPDSVGAPRPGVWGGPFVLAGSTPGLEVVLRRNDRWYGGPGPFLDEVRLVLVPDSTTARQLLERGELDVLMPPAGTNRTAQLRARPGLSIETAAPGGWWVGLHLNDDRMDGDDRRGLVATVDRARFVRVLLQGEAAPLTGFGGPRDTTWPATLGAGDAGPLDGDVDVVGFREEPMTYLLQRAMQKRARDAGARLELRNAEADRVEGWLLRGEYGAGVVVAYDAPDLCWRCRWATVDDNLARAADAGDANAVLELERKLRDEALLLPLWRPVTVVAWRGPVRGVRANGWALSAAWNAAEWWLEP